MDRVHARKFSFRRKGSSDRKKDKQLSCDQSISFDYEKISFVSKEDAINIQMELCDEYAFSLDQLAETSGLSSATAIAKNYRPTIFYPRRSSKPLYQNLATQCEKVHIPFLSYMPSEATLLTSSYNLIVDALFGCDYESAAVTGDFNNVIHTMMKSEVPITSIDIPSGWDDEKGEVNGLQPELLVSLTVPKLCAKGFTGKTHFLAGYCLPGDLAKKYDINLPPFHATELCVEIFVPPHELASCHDGDKHGSF